MIHGQTIGCRRPAANHPALTVGLLSENPNGIAEIHQRDLSISCAAGHGLAAPLAVHAASSPRSPGHGSGVGRHQAGGSGGRSEHAGRHVRRCRRLASHRQGFPPARSAARRRNATLAGHGTPNGKPGRGMDRRRLPRAAVHQHGQNGGEFSGLRQPSRGPGYSTPFSACSANRSPSSI